MRPGTGCAKQVEVSTLAGYRSYLDRHFLPFFGERQMAEILPSSVQDWVTAAVGSGLSPTSVRKYHVMLHTVFKRSVRDRIIVTNPCESIELPNVPPRTLPHRRRHRRGQPHPGRRPGPPDRHHPRR